MQYGISLGSTPSVYICAKFKDGAKSKATSVAINQRKLALAAPIFATNADAGNFTNTRHSETCHKYDGFLSARNRQQAAKLAAPALCNSSATDAPDVIISVSVKGHCDCERLPLSTPPVLTSTCRASSSRTSATNAPMTRPDAPQTRLTRQEQDAHCHHSPQHVVLHELTVQ
jgi:hypothetical protein